MNSNNADYLRRHIHHWLTLRDAGYIQNVSVETAKELLRIAQEEFDARYQVGLNHPQNVCELIRYVYMQFELYLEREKVQPVPVAAQTEEGQFKESLACAVTATGKQVNRQTRVKTQTRAEKFISFTKEARLYGPGVGGDVGARPPPPEG